MEKTEQDSDWANFLRRYMRVTALYGVLMAGVSLIGQLLLYPVLESALSEDWMSRLLCAAFCIVGVALFLRPMLDLHSTEYTTLWVKNRYFRLPLITLTALRFMLIVVLLFVPLKTFLNIHSLWLLPAIILAILLIYRSGWMSSAYISVEAQFMANFNERSLHRSQGDGTEWLDEKLYVEQIPCGEDLAGKTLKQLNWGYLFSVNVIKVIRGKKHHNMPSGDLELHSGDRIFLLGKPEDLRTLRLSLNRPEPAEPLTLRQFIASQEDSVSDVYSYAIPVEKDSTLQGKTIKTSRLRETYDCMILGVQRKKLPILQPDVNMAIQTDDLVWVLGTRRMAEKLLAGDLAEI